MFFSDAPTRKNVRSQFWEICDFQLNQMNQEFYQVKCQHIFAQGDALNYKGYLLTSSLPCSVPIGKFIYEGELEYQPSGTRGTRSLPDAMPNMYGIQTGVAELVLDQLNW